MWAAVCVSESTLSCSFLKSRALVQKRASEELRGYEVRVGFFGCVCACVSARLNSLPICAGVGKKKK